MANKQFARSTSNRVLGGVLGGVADYFNWDANIVRIIFLVFSAFGGGALLLPLYILACIFIPNDKHVGKNGAPRRDVTPDDED